MRAFATIAFIFSTVTASYCQSTNCIAGDCNNGWGIYSWTSGTGSGDKYFGQFIDGNRSGLGVYIWSGGDKYIGNWSNGTMNGYGTQFYPSGTIEIGYWQDGKLSTRGEAGKCLSGDCNNGYGTWIYSSGDIYVGYWSNGLRSGSGTYVHSDGAQYVGSSEQDKRSGYGTYYWADGSSHAGYWKDGDQNGDGVYTKVDGTKQIGKFEDGSFVEESTKSTTNVATTSSCIYGNCQNGFGIYSWEEGEWKGDKYIGEWKDGNMDGKGFFLWNTGSKYIGGWAKGKQNGYGAQFFSDGTKSVGYFQDGTKTSTNTTTSGCLSGDCNDGYGTWIYESGDMYEGYWSGGSRSGSGTYIHSDGAKYVGNFENNKRSGYGTFTWADGSNYVGTWKDGNQDGTGTYLSIDGTKQVGKFENGKYVGESNQSTTNLASTSSCIKGDCENGFGIYVWGEGNWKGDKYIGEWKEGNMSGDGVYQWHSGSKYIGGWEDGKQSGYGSEIYVDGLKKVGSFSDAKFTGSSTDTLGCFSGNCKDGYGIWIYKEGDKYEGYFKDGFRSGQGTYLYADGMKYVGSYDSGKRNGFGTFYWIDGSLYTGTWKDGDQNGKGSYTKADGTIQKGYWEAGSYKGDVNLDNSNNYQNIASNSKETNTDDNNVNFSNKKASLTDRIKAYVEEKVNEWQQKGEFEKTVDYKARVNETSRGNKIEEFQKEAIGLLKKEFISSINYQAIKLGLYDADNESFLLSSDELGEFVVPVPVAEAPNFKKAFSTYQFSNTDLYIKDSNFSLAHTEITNPASKKKYVFDSKNSVTYATTSINYTFNNIVIDVEDKATGSASNIKKGTNSITVGKSDVDINIPVSSSIKNNVYALIIGNEDYTTFQPGLSSEVNVDFAVNDAKVFKEYCLKTIGIPEKQIKLLVNATSAQMNQGIAWLTNLISVEEGNAEVILYYSGHGLPDEKTKEGYLIPVDVSGSNANQGVNLNSLYAKLNEFSSKKVTVFLDACFSGGARNQGLVAMKGVKVKPKDNVVNGNMVVFTSSTGEESSGVYREKQHGYLTYFLLKNIQETKGDITYKELANKLINSVKKETALSGKVQTPQVNISNSLDAAWENWKVK